MFSHAIDTVRGILFTEVEGRPTYGDVLVFLQRILEDPRYQPGYGSVVCLSGDVDLDAFLDDESGLGRRLCQRYAERRAGVRWAFVTEDETLLARLRRLCSDLPPGLVETAFFRDRGEAVAWVQAPKGDAR